MSTYGCSPCTGQSFIPACCRKSTPEGQIRTLSDVKQEDAGCCSRFCADWRVIPAIFTLCVCIMGVVLCLMWNHDYLAIAFGAGALFSMYMISLAYDFRHLASLEETSEELGKTNAELKTTAGALRIQLDDATKHAKNLETTAKTNAKAASELTKLKTGLNRTNTATQRTLEKAAETLTSANTNEKERATQFLHVLNELNNHFNATREHEGVVTTQADTMTKLVSELSKMVGDNSFLNTMVSQLTSIHQQIGSANNELTTTITALKAVKDDLSGAASSATVAASNMTQASTTLTRAAAEAAKSFASDQSRLLNAIGELLPRLERMAGQPPSSDNNNRNDKRDA